MSTQVRSRPLFRFVGIDEDGLNVYGDEAGQSLAFICSNCGYLICPRCKGHMRIIGRRAPKQSPLYSCRSCAYELVMVGALVSPNYPRQTTVRAAERFVGGVSIEIHCRQCGRAFVPSPDAIRAGPEVYRYCEQCRPPEQEANENAGWVAHG